LEGEKIRISVIGGGSWATALVKILCESDISITWWLRNPDDVEYINKVKHNPKYLSDVQIDLDKVKTTSNLKEAIDASDNLLMAVPSAFIHNVLQQLNGQLLKGKKVISAIKGVIPETMQIAGNYFKEKYEVREEDLAIVTGPCHAEEVALEKLSYLTIACKDSDWREDLMKLFSCRYIKVAGTGDIYGAEYAAVLKNIYAIAGGICHGMGFGDNFHAVLVTNALQEMENFLDAAHYQHRDVKENAYLGDLLVTTYSQFSRNRTFGTMIGKGYSVKAAQLEMNMIAEGYFATRSIHEINKEVGASMPILDAIYQILYEGKSSKTVIPEILNGLA
jgi:glycerol-3-phosphate dehydrogenase (NAD(P)+)